MVDKKINLLLQKPAVFYKIVTALVFVIFIASIFLFGYTWEGFKGGVDYSAYPSQTDTDAYTGALIDQDKANVECKRVWGYNGLFCNPETADKLIDPFFNSGSSMNCEGSGITKSSGNVCLNEQQRRLLTTRGGNASGGDAQIG